jgi:hypothetical protein
MVQALDVDIGIHAEVAELDPLLEDALGIP